MLLVFLIIECSWLKPPLKLAYRSLLLQIKFQLGEIQELYSKVDLISCKYLVLLFFYVNLIFFSRKRVCNPNLMARRSGYPLCYSLKPIFRDVSARFVFSVFKWCSVPLSF